MKWYVVQLCKNKEFFVISYKDVYGELSNEHVRKMVEIYINDGWELIKIDSVRSLEYDN